jgi:hypothetical protein
MSTNENIELEGTRQREVEAAVPRLLASQATEDAAERAETERAEREVAESRDRGLAAGWRWAARARLRDLRLVAVGEGPEHVHAARAQVLREALGKHGAADQAFADGFYAGVRSFWRAAVELAPALGA